MHSKETFEIHEKQNFISNLQFKIDENITPMYQKLVN